ncbi:uncharacterized protein B0I36DRAFT_321360 [Microdochium trichocladiopsis]|uniref:Urease accessory protein UreD n=1 Tax=Microdochium trichocladiopsis TaxID=1682393 RepID=A0A9P9BRX7_9PEZI|nr:uncharacterized protein B0I36DRAFT_321360 [Microdochium trichocladiopsis]KAH7033401.1 hypothetical protein B0I36DRAFT_321360 [Microdochium trichocladiopsis]
MPHKHTRRDQDESAFDLPPTQFARPLPVKSNRQTQNDGKGNKSQKGKPVTKGKDSSATTPKPAKDDQQKRKRKAKGFDDAPRAFKRLMAVAGGKKIRSGLDNGEEPPSNKKKQKNKSQAQDASPAKVETTTSQGPEIPTIRPGEKMSEFAARVDAALPVTGLITKSVRGKADPLGAKKWQTNKERKMHKLYDEWREEDRKIKEKKEEELELLDEEDLEDEDRAAARKLEMQASAGSGKRKKKGKRSKYLGEVSDPEDDPWEALRKKRGEKRPGLHDVAQAPPELNKKLPKKLLVRGAAVEVDGVPKAAGSLRRREELQTVRDDVVAQYRKLMSEKRAKYESAE